MLYWPTRRTGVDTDAALTQVTFTEATVAAANLPNFLIPSNEQLIARFVEYETTEKGLSALTIGAYRADLLQLGQFLGSRELVASGHRDIGNFIEKLLSDQIKIDSVRRKISSVREFYKFLLLDDLIQTNPMVRIESPKRGRALPKPLLSESEVATVLETLRPHRKSRHAELMRLRDSAALELLYGAGLRVSELVNARLADVNLADRCIRVHGKRDKERIAPFGHRCADALREYLAPRSDSSPWLFPSSHRDGRQLTRVRIWQMVHARFQQIGCNASPQALGRKVSPHTLRHACATHMMENGANLRVVQEVLGHADISSTEIYTHVCIESAKKIYLRCHPRATGKSRQMKLQLDLIPAEILMAGPVLCSQCTKVAQQSEAQCETHLEKSREAARRSRERAKLRRSEEKRTVYGNQFCNLATQRNAQHDSITSRKTDEDIETAGERFGDRTSSDDRHSAPSRARAADDAALPAAYSRIAPRRISSPAQQAFLKRARDGAAQRRA